MPLGKPPATTYKGSDTLRAFFFPEIHASAVIWSLVLRPVEPDTPDAADLGSRAVSMLRLACRVAGCALAESTNYARSVVNQSRQITGSARPTTLKCGPGDIDLAECLCASNLDSRSHRRARGTIYRYGLNGVCHTLTNQILFSTGTAHRAPLTSDGARYYWASLMVFSTYGKALPGDHPVWTDKVAQCGGPGVTGDTMDDDFLERARNVLTTRGSADKIGELIELRRRVDAFQREAAVSGKVTAEELNRVYNTFLREAAGILTADEYADIFEAPPGRAIAFVDPHIHDAQSR